MQIGSKTKNDSKSAKMLTISKGMHLKTNYIQIVARSFPKKNTVLVCVVCNKLTNAKERNGKGWDKGPQFSAGMENIRG